MKIGDLFGEEVGKRIKTIRATKHEEPKIQPIQDGKVKRRYEFEEEVFSYLLRHKEELEIDVIYTLLKICALMVR